MPHINLLRQVPDDCFEPVTIDGFVVTLVEIEPFDGGFRWIYRIDNIDAPNALSDWVLAIEEPCRDFIGDAFITPVFPSDEEPPELVLYEDVENPGTAPDPCPDDAPCSPGEQVVGFKFDNLGTGDQGELDPGESQLFAFVFNQPPIATEACAALKFGQNEECGLICVPDCIVCPNACECVDDIDTFDCTATVPTTCFTIPAEVATEDVLFGFCIVDEDVVAPTEPCQAPAEVFVCGQTLTCCCEVFPWTRTVTLDIQFNVPKTADCQTDALYECCFDTIEVTQTCFTCNIDDDPFPGDLTCEDITITINSVTTNDAGTSAVINYTVELPECVVPEEEPPVVGTPTVNSCPPAPTTTPIRNTQTRNTPAVNRTLRRRR